MKTHKYFRLLELYSCFTNGQVVYKRDMAMRYRVDERTIQRDIDDIRAFLANQRASNGNAGISEIIYDRSNNGYRAD